MFLFELYKELSVKLNDLNMLVDLGPLYGRWVVWFGRYKVHGSSRGVSEGNLSDHLYMQQGRDGRILQVSPKLSNMHCVL